MFTYASRTSMLLIVAATLLLAACQVPLPYLAALPDQKAAEPQARDLSADQKSGEATEDRSKADGLDVESPLQEGIADGEADRDMDGDLPTATIVVSSLRIRSGPGTAYAIVGAAQSGQTFAVLGQAYECGWLTVEHPLLGAVWLSGASQYTAIDVGCEEIPVAEIPPAPTPVPASATPVPAPVSATETPPEEDGPPPPPTALPEPEPEPAGSLPNDKGCYLIQNFVGPELYATFTGIDSNWTDSFYVPEDGETDYCFDPGSYTFTIDAPPPWPDINGKLTVFAGEHFIWPINVKN